VQECRLRDRDQANSERRPVGGDPVVAVAVVLVRAPVVPAVVLVPVP
jgi:hypothetical protein